MKICAISLSLLNALIKLNISEPKTLQGFFYLIPENDESNAAASSDTIVCKIDEHWSLNIINFIIDSYILLVILLKKNISVS